MTAHIAGQQEGQDGAPQCRQGKDVDYPTNPPATRRDVIPLCQVTLREPHPGLCVSLTPAQLYLSSLINAPSGTPSVSSLALRG